MNLFILYRKRNLYLFLKRRWKNHNVWFEQFRQFKEIDWACLSKFTDGNKVFKSILNKRFLTRKQQRRPKLWTSFSYKSIEHSEKCAFSLFCMEERIPALRLRTNTRPDIFEFCMEFGNFLQTRIICPMPEPLAPESGWLLVHICEQASKKKDFSFFN